jgi:hypothetical protein
MRHRSGPLLLALLLWIATATARGDDDDGDYPKTVAPPMLGVYTSIVPDEVLRRENLGADQGVYVVNTVSGTAAEQMGVRAGDVLLSYNGESISSMSQLRASVEGSSVGADAQVTVLRDGQRLTMSAPLEQWPAGMTKWPIPGGWERAARLAQAQRLERERERVDALAKEVEDLGRRYPQPDAAGRDRIAALAQGLADRAGTWALRYRIGPAPRTVAVAAASLPPAVAAVTAADAWSLDWSNAAEGEDP